MTHGLVTTFFASTSTCTSDPAAAPAPHGGSCEFSGTPRRTTLGRLGVAITLGIAVLTGACGGGGGNKRGDTYVAATSAQEQCCEGLKGGARDTCLASIVRVADDAVARSKANQDTYACVQEHFQCDVATGMATQASAQEQLDCIQDLP